MGSYYIQVLTGMKKILLTTILIASFCLVFAEDKGELPDAIIKAEDVLKLDSTKPHLEIEIEQNKELKESLGTEKEIFFKKPTGWEKQPKDSLPKYINSPQVIVPRTHHICEQNVYEFFPLADLEAIYKEKNTKDIKKLARWELIVADDSGQVFRKYADKGLPPERIIFDGRSDDNKVINVGYSYSTILHYYDTEGKLHTFVGNPFVIKGLARQEAQGFTISLDFQSVYSTPPTVLESGRFSQLGEDLLKEAGDIIKREHFNLPFEIAVLSHNEAAAAKAAKELSERFAQMLIYEAQDIQHKGIKAEQSIETIDIRILGTEHLIPEFGN